ncbi:class I SAM-dependent methyltransferase [Streptomyces globisporus]|uniref:class I SAM-dependent methyltransferase n=1 Tax=Streptomyces TaxID=1883 RepID=UPI00190A6DD0|nr:MULTISPECIES: class I SAM-dependent methyltransferase [unclassified Streptomyces]MBK3556459.1 class I SAM-dependent methyltransferase [Streptomyces sp. MBT56]MBK6046694.1 class I SAM-dependent methyltransferase [Streptomyces sp. MBT55]
MTLLRGDALSEAFDQGSAAYDRLVAASPGYHGHLRRSARRLGLADGGAGLRVLDLGCGTGASTEALIAAAPLARVTGVDASAGMLERAAAKPRLTHVEFVHAPAEALAGRLAPGSFDAVFAGYLLRNVQDADAVLGLVRRLLVPSGRLAVHEYTLGGSPVDRVVWNAVCSTIIRPAGRLTGDARLYRHLQESVNTFDTAPEFAGRLRKAGFQGVRVLPLPGWQTGITHTFVGRTAQEA